jgi:hypothetical protein
LLLYATYSIYSVVIIYHTDFTVHFDPIHTPNQNQYLYPSLIIPEIKLSPQLSN